MREHAGTGDGAREVDGATAGPAAGDCVRTTARPAAEQQREACSRAAPSLAAKRERRAMDASGGSPVGPHTIAGADRGRWAARDGERRRGRREETGEGAVMSRRAGGQAVATEAEQGRTVPKSMQSACDWRLANERRHRRDRARRMPASAHAGPVAASTAVSAGRRRTALVDLVGALGPSQGVQQPAFEGRTPALDCASGPNALPLQAARWRKLAKLCCQAAWECLSAHLCETCVRQRL